MADSPRALSAELAIVVCQLTELAKLTRRLPPAATVSLTEQRNPDTYEYTPQVRCYIHDGPTKTEGLEPEHLRQINALRLWARALGAELTLEDPRPHYRGDGTVNRCLSTEAPLPNGLHVYAYTMLHYDPDAPEYHGHPAAAPAIAA